MQTPIRERRAAEERRHESDQTDGAGLFPLEFEHGRKGAYGFSTRERCAEFIRRLQLDLDQQRVTSFDRENLIGWLESCLEVGVEVLIIDDDPEEPAVWAAEIRDVLQALRWVRDEDFGQERAEVVCEQWDCAD